MGNMNFNTQEADQEPFVEPLRELQTAGPNAKKCGNENQK